MLATQCSFCQHENIPGTRFCAECGSPLHLKVCPNPACGKVTDVGAAVCESCGQAFPKIALVAAESTGAAESVEIAPQGKAPAAEKDKSRMPAWPLVMVAIVAGGLPLMWANRAQLPTPKTWQVSPADEAKTPAAVPPAPTPPPTVPAPITPPPITPAAVVPAPAAPLQIATPNETAPGNPGPKADAADDSAKDPTPQPAPVETRKKVAKAPPTKKAEAPRPCTEAVAALGLCDPKRATK